MRAVEGEMETALGSKVKTFMRDEPPQACVELPAQLNEQPRSKGSLAPWAAAFVELLGMTTDP